MSQRPFDIFSYKGGPFCLGELDYYLLAFDPLYLL